MVPSIEMVAVAMVDLAVMVEFWKVAEKVREPEVVPVWKVASFEVPIVAVVSPALKLKLRMRWAGVRKRIAESSASCCN